MNHLTNLSGNLTGIAENAEKLYKKFMGIPAPVDENQAIIQNIRDTKEKILKSEVMFNELTDSDLIDYASYDLLAEKSRYSYLLKEAKKRNLRF
ncbi:MAG: YaaL family protein [Anaerovoracaceae bacterium]